MSCDLFVRMKPLRSGTTLVFSFFVKGDGLVSIGMSKSFCLSVTRNLGQSRVILGSYGHNGG